MLNRRYLRIKVLQALYSFFHDDDKNMVRKEKDLLKSIENIYDLYIYILLLFKDIRLSADRLIEERKKKMLPTPQDINPNLRFIENPLLLKIASSPALDKEKNTRKLGLTSEEDHLLKELYTLVVTSKEYAAYMADTDITFEKEKHFICVVYRKLLSENESLKQHLFEKNIHWASDFMLANICIGKTLEAATENEEFALMPMYKAEEDRDFMLKLFKGNHFNGYRKH